MNDGGLDRLAGTTVADAEGTTIGKVGDVLYEDASGEPGWARVDMGLLSTRKVLVPLTHAYRSSDGKLVVP